MDNKTIDINTENFKVVNGDITEEQIAGWKGKYGRVVEVEVADTDFEELHRGYFHRPDMQTMQAFSATAKQNEVRAAEVLFDNCWLRRVASDEERCGLQRCRRPGNCRTSSGSACLS